MFSNIILLEVGLLKEILAMLQIVIDTGPLSALMAMPPDQLVKSIMINVGWIPVAAVILWGIKEIWLDYINGQWGSQFKKVLLAIDVPKGNEQGIEAVENLMTYFHGAHGTFNLIETYWDGAYQLSFSLEIVSIDGYTQFLIRTPEVHRNLVESSIYSQYPDAEITEVKDYTEGMPSTFPDDEWDIYGAEFIHQSDEVFPIKTYKEFYTNYGATETQFKDPMASLMDLCSSLKKGEQFWYQLVIKPAGFSWPKDYDKAVKKMLNEKVSEPKGALSGLAGGFFGEMMSLINEALRQIADLFLGFGESSETVQEEDALRMMNLKPKEKKQVEAIQQKASKLGYDCKQRIIYIAKKDVMNKPKVVGGFVGYIKQLMDMDLNGFKPDLKVTATRANYFFRDMRVRSKKRKIMQGYKDRDTTLGRKTYLLNIEEMATLWHFPIEASVKAPLIQKTPGRKAEPPMALPFGTEAVDETFDEFEEEASEDIFTLEDSEREQGESEVKEEEVQLGATTKKGGAPENLPFEG